MKLTVAFTCTSLPLTFIPLFSDVVVVSDLNENFGGKKARIGGFAYPYSTPSLGTGQKVQGGGGSEHFEMWWLENT